MNPIYVQLTLNTLLLLTKSIKVIILALTFFNKSSLMCKICVSIGLCVLSH